MAQDDRTIELCGPCRHFEQALTGAHACSLGLPLMDGVTRKECAKFHPFALGEGGLFELSDCCAAERGEAHTH